MSIEDFDTMIDDVENMGDITEDYYPTVEELRQYDRNLLKEKFLPIIAYFASNPFKRSGATANDVKSYMNTVSFCKRFLYSIEIG